MTHQAPCVSVTFFNPLFSTNKPSFAMAFRFSWPIFGPDFLERATAQLESALNKGTKPAQIVGAIKVKELHLGTVPPDLEMLEIGELAEDKFRGMFKLTYSGDAYLVLQMSVQVGCSGLVGETSEANASTLSSHI